MMIQCSYCSLWNDVLYNEIVICMCGASLTRIPYKRDLIKYEEAFIREFPCMYEGEVLCNDCPRVDCDMKAGRELHEKYFAAGWVAKATMEE